LLGINRIGKKIAEDKKTMLRELDEMAGSMARPLTFLIKLNMAQETTNGAIGSQSMSDKEVFDRAYSTPMLNTFILARIYRDLDFSHHWR
jgi:hypothetical protein